MSVVFVIVHITFSCNNNHSLAMVDDDDDSDDGLMIEAAVAHHNTTVNTAIDAFVEQEQEQQRAITVLAIVSDFGIPSLPDLLTLDALLLFHDLLSIMGHNWRGS